MGTNSGSCSRCGRALSGTASLDICGVCQKELCDHLEEPTLKLWANSVNSTMTAEDSIRSRKWQSQADSLPTPRTRSVRDTSEGSVASADFELGQKIGAGGMGVVYVARQTAINRNVALKMVRPEREGLASSEALISEAIITGCLDHPNVVPVYDLGTDDEGRLFYAMKEVEGLPWNALIGEKSLDENLDILLRVADTIAFSHSKGILHRDLKPQNIMLGAFGEIMVMDWGAACSVDGSNMVGVLPSDTAYCGTPAYMAPEMAKADANRLGVTSDIYLLGAILYHIITGHPPRQEKDPLLCLAAAARNQIDAAEEDGELLRIALKAMADAPADRFQSVGEFQEAIRAYRSHSESLVLLASSRVSLGQAKRDRDYDKFNQAMYGLREALSLWPDNPDAEPLLQSTILEYAQCACSRRDYELALSLLDDSKPVHLKMINEIRANIRERDSRKNRIRKLLITARFLLVAVAVLFCIAFFMIRAQQKETRRAHKQSLINLISAYYGEQNYEACVVAFYDLYDQYGLKDIDEDALIKVRVSIAMNPYRGYIDARVQHAQKVFRANEMGCVWVVGDRAVQKIRLNKGSDSEATIAIHDFKFRRRSQPGQLLETIELPEKIVSGDAVCESPDGTLWAGSGSTLYEHDRETGAWQAVLDVSTLTFKPLPSEYNLEPSEEQKLLDWMNSQGREEPVTAILVNKEKTAAALALGYDTVCWIDLKNGKTMGWYNVQIDGNTAGTPSPPQLQFSPDEKFLIMREGVRNGSIISAFELNTFQWRAYFYARDYPVRDMVFPEPNRFQAITSYGALYAPTVASFDRFNPHPGREKHHDIWAPETYLSRSLKDKNISVSALSPDGKRCCTLSNGQTLFAGSTSETSQFEIRYNLIKRNYIDCVLMDEDKAVFLTDDSKLHLYDIGSYALKSIPLEEHWVDIDQGHEPTLMVGAASEKGNRAAIYTIDFSKADHPRLSHVATESSYQDVCCDPKGRFIATAFVFGGRIYDIDDGVVLMSYKQTGGRPSDCMSFDQTGRYLLHGKSWSHNVKIIDTDHWQEIISDDKRSYQDLFLDRTSSTTNLVLAQSHNITSFAFNASNFSLNTVNWHQKTGGVALSLIPYKDPESGRPRFWCRTWFDQFRSYDVVSGEPAPGLNMYWHNQGLSNPVYNPEDSRIIFPMQDGRVNMVLKTDLYPVFDPAILDLEVEKAALNSDASRLYLLSGGKLYAMKLPDLDP